MCVIVYKPKGKGLPPEVELEAMFAANPDGAGFAYASDGDDRVSWSKGYFDPFDFMAEVAMAEQGDRAMLLHMRWATHGTINSSNCHPFPFSTCFTRMGRMTGSSKRGVLAHNGVLHNKIVREGASDSMQAVSDIARCGLHAKVDTPSGKRVLEMLFKGSRSASILPGGKVVLTGDWILTQSGCYVSNTRWKKHLPMRRVRTRGKRSKKQRDKIREVRENWRDQTMLF